MDDRTFRFDHGGQQRIHLGFPSLTGHGAGHCIDLFHTQYLELWLPLESLGIKLYRASIDVEKPKGWFRIIFSEISDPRSVSITTNTEATRTTQVAIAKTTDRLVGAPVLVIFFTDLVRDDINLLEVKRRLEHSLIVFEDFCFPVIGKSLSEIDAQVKKPVVSRAFREPLAQQDLKTGGAVFDALIYFYNFFFKKLF